MRRNATKIPDLKTLKAEFAKEHGVEKFEDIDRGNLTSRANGNIVRSMVENAERKMEPITEATKTDDEDLGTRKMEGQGLKNLNKK